MIWSLFWTLALPVTTDCRGSGEPNSPRPVSACASVTPAASGTQYSQREYRVYWRAFQELVPKEGGAQRFLSPEEVVSLGGDIVAGGSFTGIPPDVPRTKRLRENMANARRIAAERGVELCQLILSRPDHYVEMEGAGTVPGFLDTWILRTPVSEYQEDVKRFESHGWSVVPQDFVSKRLMTRIMANPEMKPNFYGPVAPSRRQYEINGVLVDLRDPGYRRWQLDWLQSLVKFLGADGVAVGIKTGWHARPMYYPKASPDGRYGGPLSDTPYREGEYEAAITAWIVEAKQRGLRILVRDSTPGPGGPGAWFPPELEDAIVGRYKPISLPGNSTIQKLIRHSID